MKIRQHGDFHLGQVLIAKDDAYILDFEGEPRRSLEERRSKQPAARDVAGFIRSIDYATSAAIHRAPNLNPEDRDTLAKRIRSWGERLTAAYWESYRETLGETHLWPAEEPKTHDLLNLFLLEKALYEIEYELSNRPAWSHIPIEATLRILEQRGVISHELTCRLPPARSSPAATPIPSTISACIPRTTRRWCASFCPTRAAWSQSASAASASSSASTRPACSPAPLTARSATGCARNSATARWSWKTPTASRPCSPITTFISWAKAITCGCTKSSAPMS